jgi:hypothetical protein
VLGERRQDLLDRRGERVAVHRDGRFPPGAGFLLHRLQRSADHLVLQLHELDDRRHILGAAGGHDWPAVGAFAGVVHVQQVGDKRDVAGDDPGAPGPRGSAPAARQTPGGT